MSFFETYKNSDMAKETTIISMLDVCLKVTLMWVSVLPGKGLPSAQTGGAVWTSNDRKNSPMQQFSIDIVCTLSTHR